MQRDAEHEAAFARLELKAAEIRRKVGNEELKRQHRERVARWRAEMAELKLYYVECAKARAEAGLERAPKLPPHPVHNKAAWIKWREAKHLQQFPGGGGVISDLLRSQGIADQRQRAREQRKSGKLFP